LFFFLKDSLTEPPIPMNETTKSNLPLYLSADRRFVLKCIAKEDVEQIHNILPEYHRVRSFFHHIEIFLFCSVYRWNSRGYITSTLLCVISNNCWRSRKLRAGHEKCSIDKIENTLQIWRQSRNFEDENVEFLVFFFLFYRDQLLIVVRLIKKS